MILCINCWLIDWSDRWLIEWINVYTDKYVNMYLLGCLDEQ